MCNEGITILEFNLKLSEDDYKRLQSSEKNLAAEEIKKQEEEKNKIREEVIQELKKKKYGEQWARGANRTKIEDIVVTEEEIKPLLEQRLNQKEVKEKMVIPALSLNYKQAGGVYNYDKFNPNTIWYASIFIDDEPHYVRNWQNIEKINDYEYKIYTLYTLTDDAIKGKDNFKITLKNNKLVNKVIWRTMANNWHNDCQWFADNNYGEELNIIDLPGEFEVNVSKNNILQDSAVIENLNLKTEFRNITQTVEKVIISPIQTIVKINHTATKQSSNAHMNRYSDPTIEHLPFTRKYVVYDAQGKELSCFSVSNNNTLIYSDGTREDYDYHDIPNKKYNNATWETIEYLLIENTDTEYIKIVPIEVVRNPIDGTDAYVGEIEYEMEPLIIKLKD